MTKSIKTPEVVEIETATITTENFMVLVKAQETEMLVDIRDFPPVSLDYALSYGIRRAYQDSINSQAKALRDNDEPVDGAALMEARHAAMIAGEVSARGATVSAFTALENVMYSVVTDAKPKMAWVVAALSDMSGESTSDRKNHVLATLQAQPEAIQTLVKTQAQSRIDDAAALSIAMNAVEI